MLKKIFHFHKKDNRGFTLFLAVILSAVLFLISYAITNIALKETTLSIMGKESEIAFYAADSGVECALFWDLNNGPVSPFDPGEAGMINCNGQSISTGSSFGDESGRTAVVGGNTTSVFFIDYSNSTFGINECAIVSVTKDTDSFGAVTTLIESRGYNTCNNASVKRLERGIKVFY